MCYELQQGEDAGWAWGGMCRGGGAVEEEGEEAETEGVACFVESVSKCPISKLLYSRGRRRPESSVWRRYIPSF